VNQELARKQPAIIVRQAATPRVLTLAAPTQQELREALARKSRAGEVRNAHDWRQLKDGHRAGYWAVDLVLVPPRRDPRWAVVCKRVGFVLLGMSAFMASLAWLLTALTTSALTVFLMLVLSGLAGWLRAKYRRSNVVTITTTTTVQTR
jgi:hypothetical protein